VLRRGRATAGLPSAHSSGGGSTGPVPDSRTRPLETEMIWFSDHDERGVGAVLRRDCVAARCGNATLYAQTAVAAFVVTG